MAAEKELGPILEIDVRQAGLLKLQKCVGQDDLLEFPKRKNGSAMLLKQSFFERLFTGRMEVGSCPPSDLSGAQADVRYLSLAQLLFIRCQTAQSGVVAPVAQSPIDQFMTAVDSHLDLQLVARLVGSLGGRIQAPSSEKTPEIAKQVVLLYGAADMLPDAGSDLWLLRSGGLEGLLDVSACSLQPVVADKPCCCAKRLAKQAAAEQKVQKSKHMVHWEVVLSSDPANFKDTTALDSAAARRRSSTAGSAFRERLAMKQASSDGLGAAAAPATAGGYPATAEATSGVVASAAAEDPQLRRQLEQLQAEVQRLQEACSQQAAEHQEALKAAVASEASRGEEQLTEARAQHEELTRALATAESCQKEELLAVEQAAKEKQAEHDKLLEDAKARAQSSEEALKAVEAAHEERLEQAEADWIKNLEYKIEERLQEVEHKNVEEKQALQEKTKELTAKLEAVRAEAAASEADAVRCTEDRLKAEHAEAIRLLGAQKQAEQEPEEAKTAAAPEEEAANAAAEAPEAVATAATPEERPAGEAPSEDDAKIKELELEREQLTEEKAQQALKYAEEVEALKHEMENLRKDFEKQLQEAAERLQEEEKRHSRELEETVKKALDAERARHEDDDDSPRGSGDVFSTPLKAEES
eukprot:TRINITY_DN43458_c0_g1_i1.p1 TRINITY_DN43458_c0_g1~~TRINITY_DN43458_c0_g1_i1.p1  ORF type:complete len:642 (+),score=273.09 TRINITY_DN43458_c0_g1_i1:88-2013(+)